MSQMQIGERTFTIGCIRDISGRKAYTEALEHRTLHDDLTGLPNRALFGDRMDRAIADADRAGEPRGVLLVDVDDFRTINETLGRESGDALLQTVAERLRTAVRNSGHRGAHGRRRVRHPPVRRDRRRDGRGDRLEGPLGVRGAVPHRRRGPQRAREHRDRVLPAARPRHRRPAAARLAGDAPGQAGRPRPRRLRRRARGSDRAPADAAERAARGHPARRARPALPAEDRPGDAAHHRRRGAGALAAPDRRAADAGGLHARGGAQRADRAAHDVGARRGPAPAARVVRRRAST